MPLKRYGYGKKITVTLQQQKSIMDMKEKMEEIKQVIFKEVARPSEDTNENVQILSGEIWYN